MKIIHVLLLCVQLNLYSNILLQKPAELSGADIDRLAEKWETQFSWVFNKLCTFTCCYRQGQASCILRLFGIPLRSYNFPYFAMVRQYISSYKEDVHNYYFAQPLHNIDSSPGLLTTEKLGTLLKDKKFIVYTGAGISVASDIPSMNTLEHLLKLDQGGRVFLKELFFNPETITKAFSDFCTTAMYGLPTPAHYALHQLAQQRNICILTENVDLLQQRAGSLPLFMHSDEAHSIQIHDLQGIECILCIGLSHDDCGFLAYYKQHNPQGLLIALDLKKPSYLSNKDYIVQEDLQVVVPKLAHFLWYN